MFKLALVITLEVQLRITYHPRAEEVGLSHLIFADDVMIYFDGGSASLHAITETLKEFVGWSRPHYKSTYKIFGITSNAQTAQDIRSWAVKMLSYVGRLQLISSVINGTVKFWMSTFILPKRCLKKIESMYSRFLWSGSIETKASAKVHCTQVYLPKSEGGLGLRKFSEYNKVLCLRFIWLLFL